VRGALTTNENRHTILRRRAARDRDIWLWYLSGLAPQDRGYSPLISNQIGLVAVVVGVLSAVLRNDLSEARGRGLARFHAASSRSARL
jgi:hypothetical protein